MLKQTVTYEDFDGNSATETLYFNFSKTEIADNLELADKFQHLGEMFDGPERTLDVSEVKQILDLVKEVMRLSYGVKSEDGKKFAKGKELWTEFTQTAVYDAFLYSLFEDPAKAHDFLVGVFPQDLVAQALSGVDYQGRPMPQDFQKKQENPRPIENTPLPRDPEQPTKTVEELEAEIARLKDGQIS